MRSGEDAPPRRIRHQQIGDEQVGRRGGNQLERSGSIRRRLDGIALMSQDQAQDGVSLRVIVEDQYPGRSSRPGGHPNPPLAFRGPRSARRVMSGLPELHVESSCYKESRRCDMAATAGDLQWTRDAQLNLVTANVFGRNPTKDV